MKITSTAFKHNENIPSKYTCEGENVNPRLIIEDIPKNSVSLALIMHDPDAPMPGGFTHWVAWNIPVNTKNIEENSFPAAGVQGKNGAGSNKYIGPCPPSGTHRYFFMLYALDTMLKKPATLNKTELEREIEGHILERAELIGLYKKRGF